MRKSILITLFTCGFLFLTTNYACQEKGNNNVPAGFDNLKGFRAIPIEQLQDAVITSMDSNGSRLPSKSFGELQLTRQGFLLIPDSLFLTTNNAVDDVTQNEDSFDPPPTDSLFTCPKCGFERYWHNPQSLTLSIPCSFTLRFHGD